VESIGDISKDYHNTDTRNLYLLTKPKS